MPINLSKGQKVDLTKGNPGLKNIMVGLGWDVNAFDSGVEMCIRDRVKRMILKTFKYLMDGRDKILLCFCHIVVIDRIFKA